MDTIDITPNFAAMFHTFADRLDDYIPPLTKRPTRKAILAWLAPLTIALDCASTPEDIEQLRAHLNKVLGAVGSAERR